MDSLLSNLSSRNEFDHDNEAKTPIVKQDTPKSLKKGKCLLFWWLELRGETEICWNRKTLITMKNSDAIHRAHIAMCKHFNSQTNMFPTSSL